jgi:hypothetical protein
VNFDKSLKILAFYMDQWYLLDKKEHRSQFLELLKVQTKGILKMYDYFILIDVR